MEAIEVLQTVGIMVGDENGDFNPDQNVTRNEMAVVMSNLMEYNVASYKDTSPFTDVPSWAEPYVAACWTNGITAGYSDTIYGGSDTVTTAQAALMLMKALGYFQYSSDFGADWQLATVKQGNAIDLFVGVDSGVTQAMTRNDVAQLVLNTLKSGTVEASTDGSWTIGDVTINNNVTYSYITSNQTYDIYLDQYGYAIGVVEVEKVNNYLFITGVDTSAYNRYDTKADATAIFLDGTIQPIEIDLTKVDAATRAVLTDHPTGASLVNSWFTYTVNKNDLYTVDWVGTYADFANKAKAAQARSYNFDTAVGAENDGGTATNDIEEISKEAIVLRGGAAAGDPWYNVYGNDESIYITAEVSKITAADTGKDAGVISDVLNVTVGVDNANIDVWTKGQAKANAEEGPVAADPHGKVSNGVYTLFDDDGYVIAAVVVGEDAGTTTNLVYAHTGNLESESYDKNTEEYTWVRKVISDGKEIEITEVGDSLSELKSMSKYNWYEVKYLADGTVKSVELAASALYDVVSPDEYVDVIDDLDAAMAEHKVVLYEASDYREATHVDKDLTSQPSVEGRTFYVDTTAQKGFRVDDDVQIVFIQTNNNKETVSYESGYQRLEKVIDRLHDSDRGVGTYNFEVSAIMDNYGASVVVIRDLNEAGATVIPPVGGVTLPDEISISTATMTVNVPVFIEDADKVNDLAREALQNAGYTVTGVKVNGTDTNGNTQYELTAAKDGVSGYVFETEATVYVTVSLDVDDAVKNNAYIEDVTLSDTVVPVGGSVTVTITKVGGGSFSGTFKSQSYESDGTTPISVEKTDTGASPLTFNYSDFTQNTIIRVYQ